MQRSGTSYEDSVLGYQEGEEKSVSQDSARRFDSKVPFRHRMVLPKGRLHTSHICTGGSRLCGWALFGVWVIK